MAIAKPNAARRKAATPRHATIEGTLREHGDALYDLVDQLDLRAITTGTTADAVLAARVPPPAQSSTTTSR
jgi:hypothetical protein